MSIHTDQVYEYLDTHPVSLYEGDFQSLLGMLHYIYVTCNPIDSAAIRGQFSQLSDAMETLSLEEQDVLFGCACDLCWEHQKTAFSHGLTVGMHLMTEINGLP